MFLFTKNFETTNIQFLITQQEIMKHYFFFLILMIFFEKKLRKRPKINTFHKNQNAKTN